MLAYVPGLTRELAVSLLNMGQVAGASMAGLREAADDAEERAQNAESRLQSALDKLIDANDKRILAEKEIEELKSLRDGFKPSAAKKKKAEGLVGADGAFMSIKAFAKLLDDNGLITKRPGAEHEGQHVFHIIANSNGGPDHTHNYLYALGGTFNITIGDRLDHLNCYLAGAEAARRAVAISRMVAQDATLHKHIEKRNGTRRLFTEGPHKDVQSGDELFKKGQSLFTRSVLATARSDKKATA